MNKSVPVIFKFGKIEIWRTFCVDVPIHPDLPYMHSNVQSADTLRIVACLFLYVQMVKEQKGRIAELSKAKHEATTNAKVNK